MATEESESTQVFVQLALDREWRGWLPTMEQVRQWALSALCHRGPRCDEVTIRIVDMAEGAQLNEQYRNKHGATNVLAFPADVPPLDIGISLLGDVVVCAPVANREARQQNIEAAAHWSHLVVHGVLHLLGYDHQNPEEAGEMERREAAILHDLGYANPYLGDMQGSNPEAALSRSIQERP